MYPEAKSVGRWLAAGWHVALAYVVGFVVIMLVVGWEPTDKRGQALEQSHYFAVDEIDLGRGGNLGQPGHGHDVAADHDHELGAGR